MGCTWAGSRIIRRQKCKAVGVVSVGNCICVCIDIYIFLGLAVMPMGFVHTPFLVLEPVEIDTHSLLSTASQGQDAFP